MNKVWIAATTLTLAASLSFAPVAMAGKARKHSQREDRDVEYARVVESRPIFRTVRVSAPRQECWDERVVYQDREAYWMDDGSAGTLFGAIAGGVAGHQFGKGNGKHAATALGVLIGAGIGQRAAIENSPRPVERVGYEQRCETVDDSRFEERVEGYDVTYRYHGRLYHTRMPYDPGERIPVRVDVEPVSY